MVGVVRQTLQELVSHTNYTIVPVTPFSSICPSSTKHVTDSDFGPSSILMTQLVPPAAPRPPLESGLPRSLPHHHQRCQLMHQQVSHSTSVTYTTKCNAHPYVQLSRKHQIWQITNNLWIIARISCSPNLAAMLLVEHFQKPHHVLYPFRHFHSCPIPLSSDTISATKSGSTNGAYASFFTLPSKLQLSS